MNDTGTTIEQLRARLRAFNQDRDWGQYHCPRNLAMALSAEAGELLALYLWCEDDGPQPRVAARQEQVPDELADVAICLLNLCEAAGVDLAEAVAAKLAKNEAKYPVERVRGRMEKYDEY
jgi:NTP pyrophosphatase (non-canonical NTP hydrolase)